MSVVSFLQEFRSACDAFEIHEGAVLWLFKQFLINSDEEAMKGRVTLENSANLYQEGALKLYSATV